jgi:hypothetical protein
MKMACDACPCPDICLAARGAPYPMFCRWAVSGTAAERRHITDRSRIGPAPPPPPPPPAPAKAEARGNFAEQHLLVLGCDYRVVFAGLERDGCNCSDGGARCLMRRGRWPDTREVVDRATCVACVTTAPAGSP